MGGERAATTRKRMRGEICALCGAWLRTPPVQRGERVCEGGCGVKETRTRRVYVRFELNGAFWNVSYHEGAVNLRKRSRFTATDGPSLLLKMAEQGRVTMDLAFRQALSYGISSGRGGFPLNLTEVQFRKLL